MVSSGSFMHPPNAVEAAAVKGPTILVVDSPTTLESGGLDSYPLTDERPGGNHAATHPPTAAGAAADSVTGTGSTTAVAPRTEPPSRIWTRTPSPTRARPPSRLQQDLIAITSLPVLIVAQPSWRKMSGNSCFPEGARAGTSRIADWVAGAVGAVPLRLCVLNVFTALRRPPT